MAGDETSLETPDHESDNPSSHMDVLSDLVQRARMLLSELETVRTRLRDLRQAGSVELAHFRGTAQSELQMLERLSQKATTMNTQHVARSSNLPFLEAVWSAAKGSRDVVALQKRIILDSGSKSLTQGMRHISLGPNHRKSNQTRHDAVIVDAITEGGRKWLKCSLITNTRLLFDLAKQGWESNGSDDDGLDDIPPTFGTPDDGDRDVPLLKTAKGLARASKLFRVRTRHPTVQLILPRISPGETDEIDRVLDDCREAGVELVFGEALAPTLRLENVIHIMTPDPFDAFSSTVNIDCTILLALVSDFSHANVSKEPWFHKALQRQVEIESNENLLPSLLYPAMSNRKLVCTREAANRMREIVDTIGTPSERARTEILLGHNPTMEQSELVGAMQGWSAYPVPKFWQLPIHMVETDYDEPLSHLPPEASAVSADMTAINKSVFLYGWANGFTTITSNRTVVKQIENGLSQFIDLDDKVWPKIYLCPTARSLVGKEKRGAKREENGTGAWPLPDPLRREEQRRNGLDVLSQREGHVVEDLRPDGYPCEDVLEAKKNAAQWPQCE